MPALWPSFAVVRRTGLAAGTIGTPAKTHVTLSCDGAKQYGVYDGEGIVLSPRATAPVSATTGPPNIIVCRTNVGLVSEIEVFWKADLIGRVNGLESAVSSVPCVGHFTDFTPLPPHIGLSVAWFDYSPGDDLGASLGDLTLYSIADLSGSDAEVVADNSATLTEYGWDTDAIHKTTLAVETPRNFGVSTGIFVRDNLSGHSRLTIVGIRVGGVLFGINEAGESADDEFAGSSQVLVQGADWWRDLVRCEQLPSALQPGGVILPSPDGGEYVSSGNDFIDGWNAMSALIDGGTFPDRFGVSGLFSYYINNSASWAGVALGRSNAYYLGFWMAGDTVGSESLYPATPPFQGGANSSWTGTPVAQPTAREYADAIALWVDADKKWDDGWWSDFRADAFRPGIPGDLPARDLWYTTGVTGTAAVVAGFEPRSPFSTFLDEYAALVTAWEAGSFDAENFSAYAATLPSNPDPDVQLAVDECYEKGYGAGLLKRVGQFFKGYESFGGGEEG